MRRCAERAAAAGAFQSGWVGSGTGSSRTPPGRTGISPVGSQCEQRPTGRKRLKNTHTKNTVVSLVSLKPQGCGNLSESVIILLLTINISRNK